MALQEALVVYVFVDESQDAERFVLGAVASKDLVALNATVGSFRTITRHLNLTIREFHEVDLHRDHPRLLTRVLETMTTIRRKKRRPTLRHDLQIVASYYLKAPSERDGSALRHTRLLHVYQETFRALVWALPIAPQDTVDIVCDRFEGGEEILSSLQRILGSRVAGRVEFADSVRTKPLQLADLSAGTIRRYLGGDLNEGRFRFIEPLLYHLGVVRVRQ